MSRVNVAVLGRPRPQAQERAVPMEVCPNDKKKTQPNRWQVLSWQGRVSAVLAQTRALGGCDGGGAYNQL
jgi:hypothetical protein